MRLDDRGEQCLLVLREAGHVGILDDVSTVTVVAGVRNFETDLVQARRPREVLARFGAIDVPGMRDLIQAVDGGALDARRVLEIHAVSLGEPANGALADVFVLNSEYEGLSHTLLEVQALGTPVVCTNVCGNPEVISDGENGLLVPPGDDQTLARALEKLLADRALRERLSIRGVELSSRFDRARSFTAVERTLQELSSGSSSP